MCLSFSSSVKTDISVKVQGECQIPCDLKIFYRVSFFKEVRFSPCLNYYLWKFGLLVRLYWTCIQKGWSFETGHRDNVALVKSSLPYSMDPLPIQGLLSLHFVTVLKVFIKK